MSNFHSLDPFRAGTDFRRLQMSDSEVDRRNDRIKNGRRSNIGIKMERKDLSKSFMMS